MKIRSFDFSLTEVAGSMGDFGTLLPLAIGYIVVCDLDPAGFLVMMGVANIATGLVYRLPMPIEPMKVLAVVAIAQAWAPSMIYASGFAMGVIWIIFALTGVIGWISRITPNSVIRGIQVTLGVLLAVEAFKMISTWWALGLVCVLLVLLLRKNRYAPAAIVLMLLGVIIMLIRGQFDQVAPPALSVPAFTGFSIDEVWRSLLLAGFAQIPLTVTNATIATSSLITEYFPDREVSEQRLAWNQGIMNSIVPFLGGMPMCHGAGGLAGQYFFGARTGGANLIEGFIEICLGLFLAGSIAAVFGVFPLAIIGAMMFLVGVEMTKFAGDVGIGRDTVPLAVTVVASLATNMFFGFLAGIATHYLLRRIQQG
ncbi:MAG: putative sulfate/molybdate transporter [Armatimonadota bacterium]